MPKNSLQSLNDALTLKIMALYDIETELTKALPKMAKKASDPELRTAFEEHLAETENHVSRLEEVFRLIDVKPKKTKVEGIRGIIADAEYIIKEKPGKEVLDSMLISSASNAEHYEISAYTTAIKWAKLIGNDEAAAILEETLKEEEMSDDALASLADEGIDEKAMNIMSEDDMEDGDMPKPSKEDDDDIMEDADDEE